MTTLLANLNKDHVIKFQNYIIKDFKIDKKENKNTWLRILPCFH